MFKGIVFFIKNGWKYDKRYVIWNVLYQLLNSFHLHFLHLIDNQLNDIYYISICHLSYRTL